MQQQNKTISCGYPGVVLDIKGGYFGLDPTDADPPLILARRAVAQNRIHPALPV
jgi:hypothetical protein